MTYGRVMPELPEVQTVVDELKQSLKNLTLKDVIILRDKIRYPVPDLSELIGSKVTEVKRRAKYIIISFNPSLTLPSGEGITTEAPLPEGGVGGGLMQTIVIHLGMSGKVMIGQPQERLKHDHVVFEFDNGEEMVFNDARRFGFIIYKDSKFFDHLGPEPLEDEFDAEYLYNKLKTKTQPIKTAIMDQKLVVGVGNIYASEALFRSAIRPARKCDKVTKKECAKLVSNIKAVLNEAIASGGSTLRDYVRSSGDLGYFQHSHNVYGRAGEECNICAAEVKMLRQAGRSSFYCSKCQN